MKGEVISLTPQKQGVASKFRWYHYVSVGMMAIAMPTILADNRDMIVLPLWASVTLLVMLVASLPGVASAGWQATLEAEWLIRQVGTVAHKKVIALAQPLVQRLKTACKKN